MGRCPKGRARDEDGPRVNTVTTSEWGRVAEDGTVYVRTADGERPVGQYPEGTPEEALAFYAKRYDELAGNVHLTRRPSWCAACARRSSTPARSVT